ncbi:unnamed protein product [Phytophthora lilii]|uniref:Unnamed protein product n=1 Tax=Phytophthora lilii TaxID=2077276 RepID=A0A9W6TGL7_9STRA|nr:unnamed protein product [Phytophthora lilii]
MDTSTSASQSNRQKLNWRLLAQLDVGDVVRRGDPAALEPFALHVTFARLPREHADPTTRDAWFLLRVLQLAMEYLLFMRARDGDVLEALNQELRHAEQERDELLLSAQKWKARAHSGDKQVDKLHQVLQNIAKLLQIHGASPSAVATIEALLTELIAERRAKQRKKALMDKENDDGNEVEEVFRQEARVCGFCGKLFSSKEYLEKHLVRRHGGENVQMETPVKHKMTRNFGDDVEDTRSKVKAQDTAAAEVAMQKMVQQVKRALHECEEKMRLLAEEEAQKVQKMYEQLHVETKLVEELKNTRLQTERQHEESQRQLDEVIQQKLKAEDELSDLKQQIQFLTLKQKMIGTALPSATISHTTDEKNALAAAEAEVKKLQQTLEIVNVELSSSRDELAKVQALHLSALRKKKELTEKLALLREAAAVVHEDSYCQTDQPIVVHTAMQTEQLPNPQIIESGTITDQCASAREDVGNDPWILNTDIGVQTMDRSDTALADAEVQVEILADLAPMPSPTDNLVELVVGAPQPTLQESPPNDATEEAADLASAEQDIDKSIPDYIQNLHSQDLLGALVERAQSRFQHDEFVVKERVASCLSQLEQFSCRFGVPAKSAWLSEENLQLVQQALHGHLEVLPTEVLAKMVECENSVNAIIEREWAPMEKTRQEALERFKREAHAKSEASQGLVRQAMAAFGLAAHNTDQPSDISRMEIVEAPNTEESVITDKKSAETNAGAVKPQTLSTSSKRDSCSPAITPARRYSAKNQLTVVVDEETTTEGTAYLADDFGERHILTSTIENPREVRETLANLIDNIHQSDEVTFEDTTAKSTLENSEAGSLQDVFKKSLIATHQAEPPRLEEPEFPPILSSNPIRSIRVDTVKDDKNRKAREAEGLARSHSGEFSGSIPTAVEVEQVVSPIKSTDCNHHSDWQEDESEGHPEWHLPRVGSSTSLESPQTHVSVHPALSQTRSVQFKTTNSFQHMDSLESDQLSPMSQSAVIEPAARLDHASSLVASSEMSFGTSIPSLMEESKSIEASTSAVVRDLVGLVDKRDGLENNNSPDHSLFIVNSNAQNESVMSFDDSDIEEVVLT